MDWDKLRIFYAVAQAKSLTKAGESLALSQSAVSRQISALEERLKTPLFRRHARGLLLTEQGEILYKTTTEMVMKLHATEMLLAESSEKPRGQFTITAPTAIGTIWLAPLLKEFCDLYPDIEVTLIVDDRELDLSMREADVAIRLFSSKHPDLIQKSIVTLKNSIYASNDYLRDNGMPSCIEDLADHKIIAYPAHIPPPFPDGNWLLELPEARKIRLTPHIRMNSLNAIRRAIKAGMGIASMPDYMMHRSRNISRILINTPSPVIDVHYVYPVGLKNSRRVSVFKNFIQRKVAEYNF